MRPGCAWAQTLWSSVFSVILLSTQQHRGGWGPQPQRWRTSALFVKRLGPGGRWQGCDLSFLTYSTIAMHLCGWGFGGLATSTSFCPLFYALDPHYTDFLPDPLDNLIWFLQVMFVSGLCLHYNIGIYENKGHTNTTCPAYGLSIPW